MDVEFEAVESGGFSWTGSGFTGSLRRRGAADRWVIEGHSEAGARFEGSLEGTPVAAKERVRELVVEHTGEGVGGGD